VSRKIKIWEVEKILNPDIRNWEGEATAKKHELGKDLRVLQRRINACHDRKRIEALWHRYYSKKTLLDRVESVLEL
jgi:hypothetical protein